MRTLLITTASTLALAGMASGAVGAVAPGPVSLVVSTTFDEGQPDAVIAVDGALADDCEAGTTTDTYFHAGPPSAMWPTVSGTTTLQVGKVLHCASGDIDLRLVVRLDLTTETTSGRWVAIGGTGAYEHASGSGTITGSPFDGGVEDAYEGQLHGI